MKKPYKFTIICDKTKQVVSEQNYEPLLHHLMTYEETETLGVSRLQQTKTVWVDTRYEAKLRLFNYLTYTRKGLPIPEYKPFNNTAMGPILNF